MPKVAVRRNNPAASLIRNIRSSRNIAPKDIVDVCGKTGSHLGVIAIKCDDDASLHERICAVLRDYDMVYQSKGVIQVFTPVLEREDMKNICSRVLEVASNRQVHITYMDDPADALSYVSRSDGVDMVELVLGRNRKDGEQVYLSSDDPSYVRILDGLHPGILGKEVKVAFVEGSKFAYRRGLSGGDGWRVLNGKLHGQLEDLSYMVQGDDFVIYNTNGKDVRYDEKRKTLSEK